MDIKDLLKFAIKNRHAFKRGGEDHGRRSKTGFQGVYREGDDHRRSHQSNPFMSGMPFAANAIPGPLGFLMRHWGKLLILTIVLGIALLVLGIWLFFVIAGFMLEALGGFMSIFFSPDAANTIPVNPNLPAPTFEAAPNGGVKL